MNPFAPLSQPLGNNADSRTVRLHVQGNGGLLTPAQFGDLQALFERYKVRLALQLGGYNVTEGQLPDGSRVRMVSNGGLHDITVWVVGASTSTPLANLLFGVTATQNYDPGTLAATKFSAIAKFRGITAAPAALKPSRRVIDVTGLGQHPGSLTWFSDDIEAFGKPIVVSWYGRGTRYGTFDLYGRQRQWSMSLDHTEALLGQAIANNGTWNRVDWYDAFKPAVWLNGVKRPLKKADLSEVRAMSAALKIEDGKLWLYVVTKDTALAIYKGPVGDPYNPTPITMAHVTDIDFTVDTTGYSVSHTDDPFSGMWAFDDAARPMWEALVQPLYFNQSATHLAGLVAVKPGSTSNATAAGGGYSPVKLCQVDIEAGTTTFTASHASYNTVLTGDGTIRTDESTNTAYGAVDWVGDTLAICMLEHFEGHKWTTSTTLGSPSAPPAWSALAPTGASSSGFGPGSVPAFTFSTGSGFTAAGSITPNPATTYAEYAGSRTQTETVDEVDRTTTLDLRSKYRAYLVGGADLAAKDTGWLSVDTFNGIEQFNYTRTDGISGYLDPVSGLYFNVASSVGSPTINSEDATCSRSESFNGSYYWHASIQGGDLRHNSCIVVLELVEEGASAYSSTGDFGTTIATSFSVTSESSAVNRYVGGKLGLWTDGVERFLTAMAGIKMRTSTVSSGFTTIGYSGRPNVPFLSAATWADTAPFDDSVLRPNYSALAPACLYTGASGWQANTNPVYAVGFACANNVAFSTDSEYGYMQLASPLRTGTPSLEQAEWIAKFWIAETASFVDAYTTIPVGSYLPAWTLDATTLVLDTPPRFELALPLFIDNVPLKDTPP